MDQLKSHGRVVRGWLGVEIQEVTPELAQSFGLTKPEGALIASIEKDGPAAKSGLERGDVVLKFDGKDVHDEHELPVLVADTPINKKVPVEVGPQRQASDPRGYGRRVKRGDGADREGGRARHQLGHASRRYHARDREPVPSCRPTRAWWCAMARPTRRQPMREFSPAI